MKGWLGTLLFALLLGDGLAQTMDTVFFGRAGPYCREAKKNPVRNPPFQGRKL
ncbi:hypothetical protein ADIS_0506 [Lunatimonas lonarensis]|uniref:Uncharacterized protein n=1 Tax=Lunatimonas lonarensis TaxID=1232681 RepID=R7ZY18_9BACT|nr:hypothetical protein [Lunatimonas lonarensis]EON78913.1 hypothetical protein ADIS_0506 [Lunatimonas lonarensis]